MKAIVYDRYGSIDVLDEREIAAPTPRRGELVVEVKRAALNPKDALFRKGKFRYLSGPRFPKRSGLDFAGVVVESRSRHFSPGQRVFGMLDELTFSRGSLAERVCARENEAAVLPDAVGFDAGAASALVGLTALQALRDMGRVRPGSRVLVHGASGGVGTVAIQIAKKLGAAVTTTSSPANFALCRELGASETLDYKADFLGALRGSVDVLFDVFGNLSRRKAREALAPRAVFVDTVPTASRVARDLLTRFTPSPERLVVVRPSRSDLETLGGWLAGGSMRAVVDSTYPLAELKKAVERLEGKHARGKIVIEV